MKKFLKKVLDANEWVERVRVRVMRADKVQSLCKTLEQRCHNNVRTSLLLGSTRLRVRLGQHDIWDSMHIEHV